MPQAQVLIYREADGSCPLLTWMDDLSPKAQAKCRVKIERLRELGHEMRRPEADYLRDGIYELRATLQGIHYRLLYFFHGQAAVVLSHGLTKKREVPTREIDKALMRKAAFEHDPARHSLEAI
jgi:phage-related protein